MSYRRNLITIVAMILGLVMFVPVAQAERQSFEGISCGVNNQTWVQSDGIYIGSFEGKGIFRNTTDPTDIASYQQSGVFKGVGGKWSWNGFSKTKRPNGDLSIWELTGDSTSGSSMKLIYGTGRYKGAKGEQKSTMIANANPIVPNTEQMCYKIVGWIELATAPLSLKAKPIQDFKDVAGKWQGTLYSTDGWSSPYTIAINEDGTGDAIVPQDSTIFPYSDKGRFPMERKLVDGKLRSKNKISGDTGTMTLFEGGGKRVLDYISDNGKVKASYEPAPK
jgi:hypothetical protein